MSFEYHRPTIARRGVGACRRAPARASSPAAPTSWCACARAEIAPSALISLAPRRRARADRCGTDRCVIGAGVTTVADLDGERRRCGARDSRARRRPRARLGSVQIRNAATRRRQPLQRLALRRPRAAAPRARGARRASRSAKRGARAAARRVLRGPARDACSSPASSSPASSIRRGASSARRASSRRVACGWTSRSRASPCCSSSTARGACAARVAVGSVGAHVPCACTRSRARARGPSAWTSAPSPRHARRPSARCAHQRRARRRGDTGGTSPVRCS